MTFTLLHTRTTTRLPTQPHLSINPEGASLLVQLDGSDASYFARLLDVGAVAADGQAHQVGPHDKLFLEGRHQLPGVLHKTGGGGKVRQSTDLMIM